MCIFNKTCFWVVGKKDSFQKLLAMIIFVITEVSSIRLVISVVAEAKFHSAGFIDLPNSSQRKESFKT